MRQIDSKSLATLASAIGITDAEVDNLFRAASTITT